MLVRETPLRLESNAKMSVKPHNICLVPRPFFSFPSPTLYSPLTPITSRKSLLEEGEERGGEKQAQNVNLITKISILPCLEL